MEPQWRATVKQDNHPKSPDRATWRRPPARECQLQQRALPGMKQAVTVLGRLPRRADTSRGDLSSAQLVGAQLYDANLSGARLWEADLSGARLGGANLSGARLVRTDLSETMGLAQAQLDAARGNATTQLPRSCDDRPAGRPGKIPQQET